MKKENLTSEIAIPENIKIIKLGFVNVYLIKENDNFFLIDAGLLNQWEELEKQLLNAGCLPDKLKLVIITHGDPDHTGNCAILQEKYEVKITMHLADQVIVESGFSGKRKVKPLGKRIMFLAIKFLGIYKRMGAKKFKPDIYLEDGQSLREYGLAAAIIHVPGHTKGSIAVLTDEGDLFIGDTMVNSKKPEWANIIQDEEELKQSMEKLKKYDIKMVYPGHGRPFLMKDILV